MIEPTLADIGRQVIYTSHGKTEQGVITSISNHYVFVRYGADVHSKATRRADLQWCNP